MFALRLAWHRRCIGPVGTRAVAGGTRSARRWSTRFVLAIVAAGWIVSAAPAAVEVVTDAERSYRALRATDDRQRQLLAERWHGLVRLQEWTDDTGQFTTTAKYVAHDPNLSWVKLRVIQGTGAKRVVRDLQVPLDRLSKVGQSRVRQIAFLESRIADAVAAEQAAQEADAAQSETEGLREGGNPRELYGEGIDGRETPPAGLETDLSRSQREEAVADAAVDGRGEEGWQRGALAQPVAPIAVVPGMPLPALLPPLPSDRLRPNVPAPASDAPNPEDAPAEGTPPYERR